MKIVEQTGTSKFRVWCDNTNRYDLDDASSSEVHVYFEEIAKKRAAVFVQLQIKQAREAGPVTRRRGQLH